MGNGWWRLIIYKANPQCTPEWQVHRQGRRYTDLWLPADNRGSVLGTCTAKAGITNAVWSSAHLPRMVKKLIFFFQHRPTPRCGWISAEAANGQSDYDRLWQICSYFTDVGRWIFFTCGQGLGFVSLCFQSAASCYFIWSIQWCKPFHLALGKKANERSSPNAETFPFHVPPM